MMLFWFVVIALAVLFVQSVLFRKLALRRLRYTRHFQQRVCFRGDVIELVEELRNEKWLPVPWLRAESLLPSPLRFRQSDNFAVSSGQHYQNHRSFFSLAPYTKITRTHRITPVRRGWYKLNTVTLTGGDLLGQTLSSAQIPLNSEIVVYPRPAELPMDDVPYQSWQGEMSVRRFIVPDPFVIAGTREFHSGDTLKQVNWKATARTGVLQANQYDYTADRSLMIYLNVEDGAGMWRAVTNEPLIEAGIEWAAGAAASVAAQGLQVGFAANMPLEGSLEEAYAEPAGGQEHLHMLYEMMARLKLERTYNFGALLEAAALSGYTGRDVLMITSYWSEELERHAERLRGNGNSVTVWIMQEGETNSADNSGKAGEGISA